MTQEYEYEWPCYLKTTIKGPISRFEPSRVQHSSTYSFPKNVLEQVCRSARIAATFEENQEGHTKVTLVNGGMPEFMLQLRLGIISEILRRAVFRKGRDLIDRAARKFKLEKAITWTIYDYSGEGPGKELCLFIYYKKDLRHLSLLSLDRVDDDYYYTNIEKFKNELK
jgi:hypothetical protein